MIQKTDPRDALSDAKNQIDAEFGAGFAIRHPELVGAYLQADAVNYVGDRIANLDNALDAMSKMIGDGMLDQAGKLEMVATALDNIAETIAAARKAA